MISPLLVLPFLQGWGQSTLTIQLNTNSEVFDLKSALSCYNNKDTLANKVFPMYMQVCYLVHSVHTCICEVYCSNA